MEISKKEGTYDEESPERHIPDFGYCEKIGRVLNKFFFLW